VRAAGLALWLLLAPAPAAAAERARAQVACVPAGPAFTYDCTIRLTGEASGAPLTGVEVTVGADMPSMPMAHNVRPARARPGGAPGEYAVRLELEMHGHWALRLRLSGAVRDQVFAHLVFTSTAVLTAEPGPVPAPHRPHR